MKKYLPFAMIAASASLWGGIAFFVRGMSNLGFTAMEIVAVRVTVAAILLGAIGFLKYKRQLAIRMLDIWLFIGTGIFSIVFFNWCYFTALDSMDVSLAVILLYTAPVFVSILSLIIFKERFTIYKSFAVVGTFLGCVLVAGAGGNSGDVPAWSLLIGLGAGFGYALYSIFGKAALRKYKPFTITFYTFLVASLSMIPTTRLWEKSELLFQPETILYGAGLGLIPTVIAYFLYTKGLEQVDSSLAAIIATIEPVVATLMGVFMYGEGLGFMEVTGSIIILLSVSAANINKDYFRSARKRLQSM